jgi:hypothetical protein
MLASIACSTKLSSSSSNGERFLLQLGDPLGRADTA